MVMYVCAETSNRWLQLRQMLPLVKWATRTMAADFGRFCACALASFYESVNFNHLLYACFGERCSYYMWMLYIWYIVWCVYVSNLLVFSGRYTTGVLRHGRWTLPAPSTQVARVLAYKVLSCLKREADAGVPVQDVANEACVISTGSGHFSSHSSRTSG
jgi:hypothetical protein